MELNENKNRNTNPTDNSHASDTPFFARFLEGQETDKELNVAKPGANRETLKYPSDRDEFPDYAGVSNDAARIQTLKYPSDRDEVWNHSV